MASDSSTATALQTGDRPLLVTIVGPTAIGKTTRAIEIAQGLGCEIINADSRQIFRNMPIGTAQPSAEERKCVPHHFVDFVDVEKHYSAGQFATDAGLWLDDWFKNHKTAVMVGGSGLYIKAVLEGLDDMPADLTIRKALNQRLKESGIEALALELRTLDPEHAGKMDIKNPQRVVRALEVCLASGKPFSSFHTPRLTPRKFDTLTIGLEMDRGPLIDRINERVDAMVNAGMKNEAAALLSKSHLNALQTVGYREWFECFEGRCTEAEAIERIKVHTRQFAKRQMTWFKKMENIRWANALDTATIEGIVKEACDQRQWPLHRPFPSVD